MSIKTSSGLAYEFVRTTDKNIAKVDRLLSLI